MMMMVNMLIVKAKMPLPSRCSRAGKDRQTALLEPEQAVGGPVFIPHGGSRDCFVMESHMKSFTRIAAAAVLAMGAGTVSAMAACNGDTSTETVLGAGAGAAAGGLASHSIAGAAIGGVAGGLIGNAIGHSNNREDCRRDAYYYDRDREMAENGAYHDRYAYNRPPDSYVGRDGYVHDYPDD